MVLELDHSDSFLQFLSLFDLKSKLFALPVKLVNNERIRDAHVTSVSTARLLLIDVLVDDIYECLMDKIILIAVLEEDSEKLTVCIKLISEFIY